ncbi:MAG: aminotransferase class V-fold PLP-dependent enzyme [Candidatus Promineifilaceae bacterium]|jgi:isopenicillin-N epimerase
MNDLADLFLLTPEVVFLNHGSFGATPRPVFEVYQAWQRRFERQPVQFVRELGGFLAEAREVLGDFVGAQADDLVYVPNATFGLNIVARSLALGPGDEVLATDHEYGACANTWEFMSKKRGFRYLRQEIPLPFGTEDEIVEQFWQGVSPRTRVVFISHITSPTAVRFPVEKICARAREVGILTVVDGAHTLGQIELDMQAIDADFYLSNGHKWLCSPKGSAFLYARREQQALIEPLVVGWGWGSEKNITFGSDFLDYLQWLGTNDLAAYLAVPAAIDFQREHNWTAVRSSCHELLVEAVARICRLTGLETVYPDDGLFQQMAFAPLPQIKDLDAMKKELIDTYHVEVPLIDWHGRHFIRISVQGYNSSADIDALLNALAELLPGHAA